MTPQCMNALEQANKVRLARAQLKRDVTAGKVSVAQVVTECPWMAERMRVAELLAAQNHWGSVKTYHFLSSLRISEARTVEDLTARQRAVIVFRLAPVELAA
jgi:uncharacterized protein YecT (DUF1311 family)